MRVRVPIFVALFCLLNIGSILSSEAGENDRPNILYIMSDDHTSQAVGAYGCLLYTSPSPRDGLLSRMPSSA